MPATTIRLVPTRCTTFDESGATTIIAAANGRVRKPASNGVYPRTNCRYWVDRNTNPNRAKNTRLIVALAALNRRFRNSLMSSMGYRTRPSHNAKATNAAAETVTSPTTGRLVQPWLGASMIAVTSDTSPTTDRTPPVQSTRCAPGSRDSDTSAPAATMAAAAIGTLTMNTDPHQKWSRRNPPASGPRTTPMPTTPDQMPMAMARSRASVKVFVRMLNVAGMMN